MKDGQQDNVTLNQGTIRASSGSSGTPGSAAGGSSATSLPSTPHSDTPRPDLGHSLLGGRTTTRRRKQPSRQGFGPTSSAAEVTVDSKPATVMAPENHGSADWTTYPKRPPEEYQLSSSQSGRAWSTLSSYAGVRGEQPIQQTEVAVETAPSSPTLPSVPDFKQPTRDSEEVPADSQEGGSDSESEAGEEYKDPLSESSGRYW